MTERLEGPGGGAEHDAARPAGTHDGAPRPAGPERHVLVADDEPHIGRIIKMKLEQGPFHVTLVYDGEQAVAALSGGRPVDLVMLDLMMPRRSGLDVLAFIRGDARLRDIPCIILTAAGQEAQHRRALELGATDFITKPFSPKKLYQRAVELAGLAAEADVEGE